MFTQPRRFPPPWPVAELDEAFVVSDANGQALAYVYFRRRVAANIARLPELLRPRAVAIEPMPDDPEGMIAWGKRNITGEA